MINFNKTQNNPNKQEVQFYNAWNKMIKQSKEKKKTYCYKGIIQFKGVKVERRWLSFKNFHIDMWNSFVLHYNNNDKDTRLDRISNNHKYSKLNSRWITHYTY
jgi:hypothetical protein